MVPILHETTEREFTSGGIGSLADCVSCTVTEERNGIFECEFVYPITGPRYNDIKEGRIILVTHDDSHEVEPFDIYARSAPIDGLVTFYAHHVSYRLTKAVCMPFTATGIQNAMSNLKNYIVTNGSFRFWTDKTTTGNYSIDKPRVVKEVLGGSEGSLLDRYGSGDYKFNRFNVWLYADRGTDTDVDIRYGKNLVDITYDKDMSDSYNAIVPYWVNEETGEIMTLPEGFLKASGITYYETDLTDEGLDILEDENGSPIEVNTSPLVAIPFPMNDYFSTKPTESAMRTLAQSLLNGSNAWKPEENIKVDFVALWQTEEYKEYAPLQRVKLCDRVNVYYPQLGVYAVKEKVVKTVYNVLLDRYDEIELHQLGTSLSQMTGDQISADMSGEVNASSVQALIDNAINILRGGLGGYIAIPADSQGRSESILIMDNKNPDLAYRVLKLDNTGLSYSDGGVNGTYHKVIDMNGDLVTINGSNAVRMGDGALKVIMNSDVIGRLLATNIKGEQVSAFRAWKPFELIDTGGRVGYRYGGSEGAGSYGAIHYFKGKVKIDGDLVVTGTINGN